MVEGDGYVHDGWLKRMVMSMILVEEGGYVHDGWLKGMVMSMMDG
jgi:hypothetical protein